VHHTKDKGNGGVLAAKLDMVRKGFMVMSPNIIFTDWKVTH
jgi:hypothetical protein